MTRYRVFFIALIAFVCLQGALIVGSASAIGPNLSIGEILKKLELALKSEPHLEGFGADSPEVKAALERGIGAEEWLNEEYDGASIGDIMSRYSLTGMDEAAQLAVKGDAATLSSGGSALPQFGPTMFDIGGEALTTAEGTLDVAGGATGGLLGGGVLAAGLVPTLASGAGAFVSGYFIGTQLEQYWAGGSSTSQSEETDAGGLEVEELGWLRGFCPETACGELTTEELIKVAGIGIEPMEAEGKPVGGDPSLISTPTYGSQSASLTQTAGKPFWLLVYRTGGSWYSVAPGFKLKKLEGKYTWIYGDWRAEAAEGEYESCKVGGTYPSGGYGGVAGFPPHEKNMTITGFASGHAEESFLCENIIRKPPLYSYEPTGETFGWFAAPHSEYRKEGQMPTELPIKEGTCPVLECEYTTPPEKPAELEKLTKHMGEKLEEEENKDLAKWLAHELGLAPGGKEPTVPGHLEVPSCKGFLKTECVKVVSSYDLVPELDPRTWENADLALGSEAVIETAPKEGSEIEEGKKVGIIYNPTIMPLIIPPITPFEKWPEYKEALEKAGFSDPEKVELPESEYVPTVGPSQVGKVNPAPGTRVNPADSATPVKVGVNPPYIPPTPETKGGVEGPTLPGFDLPSFPVLCKGFPFGVPCWLAETIESWSATPKAPEWGLENVEIDGRHITGKFDLAKLEPIMEVIRPMMVAFATIGLVLLFYRFARGGSPPSGGGGDTTSSEDYSGIDGQ